MHEAIINLAHNQVESNVRLGPNVHGPGTAEEILAVEKLTLEDEKVKAEIAKLGLPEGTVIVSDPWIYGRITPQVLLSVRRIDAPQVLMASTMTGACIRHTCTCVTPAIRLTPTPITMPSLSLSHL